MYPVQYSITVRRTRHSVLYSTVRASQRERCPNVGLYVLSPGAHTVRGQQYTVLICSARECEKCTSAEYRVRSKGQHSYEVRGSSHEINTNFDTHRPNPTKLNSSRTRLQILCPSWFHHQSALLCAHSMSRPLSRCRFLASKNIAW